MLIQQEKVELIGRLYNSRQDPVGKDLLALLDIEIDEVRADNDTAEGMTIFRNQGKIEGYKELKDIIIKGLPVV